MEWIRTDEQLPPESKWVLVVSKNFHGKQRTIPAFWTGEKWYGFDDFNIGEMPVWWMPMPEPPEEG